MLKKIWVKVKLEKLTWLSPCFSFELVIRCVQIYCDSLVTLGIFLGLTHFYMTSFSKFQEKALEQLKVTETKTVAVGQKMDLVFYTLQLGFFYMDFDLISKSIDKAKK